MRIAPTWFFLGFLLLAGCATEDTAYVDKWASTPTNCIGEQDCKIKWGRALLWASERLPCRVSQANDQLIAIATCGDMYSTGITNVSIIKVQNEDGSSALIVQAGCNNALACVVSPRTVLADFSCFVHNGVGVPEASRMREVR